MSQTFWTIKATDQIGIISAWQLPLIHQILLSQTKIFDVTLAAYFFFFLNTWE